MKKHQQQKMIGIDLGGTSIKFGLVSSGGEILRKTKRKTPASKNFEGVLAVIQGEVEGILQEEGLEKKDIYGVGIGIPGVANGKGEVVFANNLFWKNKPLQRELEIRLGIRVKVGNDASLAGFGEFHFGAMENTRNALLLTLGTGLGAGVIIHGKVFHGSHYLGTEIGHMIVGENFYDCNCGNNGCLETFASATALVKYVNHLLDAQEPSSLKDLREGQQKPLTPQQIFEAARKQDEVALKALNRFTRYLAVGMANLINIFDPEVIALGGGLSESGELFLPELRRRTKTMTYVKENNPTEIVIADLKNDAGILGSAMFVLKE
ncbi:ROK family protein [Isachenkonia alkalipeptolytica]|nr:ROK family glucokinase [Isachenkonia alkalipeptolytica]